MTAWGTKRPNWLKQKWMIAQAYWRWFWMSRDERLEAKQRAEQALAMGKLLFNLLGNAPMEKIKGRESCTWSMTPGQEKGTKEGLQQYVKAVTGKDVKVAETALPTQTETDKAPVSTESQSGNG